MNITDIRVTIMEKESKVKAIAAITIDDEFVVHDIKVIEGDHGLFVSRPSRKTPAGTYKDIAHPLSSEVRNDLQEKVLNKYNEVLNQPKA